MADDARVAQHYTRGELEQTILDALARSGIDLDRLSAAELAPVDEFHIGGRQATVDFANAMQITPGLELLDVGCGIGGASRYFAGECGCQVTGIDLTDEFVQVAGALAGRVGLRDRVTYHQGSALNLPFTAESFDRAYMLHVGMNIEDKAALVASVRRVLNPGGLFGIYDVMRENDSALSFPVPWAASAETSFVATLADYRQSLVAAGFEIVWERSRDFAIEFFQKMRARGPSPLGLQILMGSNAPQMVANMIDNLDRGVIAPTEIVGRRR